MKSMLIKTQKKNKARMYPWNHLDRTRLRSIKDLLCINYKAKRRTWESSMGNPEWARKAYLACSGSQAEHRNIKLHLARSWTQTYNKLQCFTLTQASQSRQHILQHSAIKYYKVTQIRLTCIAKHLIFDNDLVSVQCLGIHFISMVLIGQVE